MSSVAVPPAGIPHVPAPWTTHCESWWLSLYIGAGSGLPEGIYDPLEASSSSFANPGEAGKFEGGLGMVMIVRYEQTPVGPYDELIIVPGNYSVPGQNKSLRRISRIYVSQRETTWNGRYNWNIPKHLARFSFTTSDSPVPGTTHLQVFPPGNESTKPFFSVTLTPFQYLPAFPFSTNWLPLSTSIAQPPIPSAVRGLSDEQLTKLAEDPEVLVGTESWKSVPINAKTPAAKVCWVEVHPIAEEDKSEAVKWWPVDVKPWKAGVWMKTAEIEIPEPVEWKL